MSLTYHSLQCTISTANIVQYVWYTQQLPRAAEYDIRVRYLTTTRIPILKKVHAIPTLVTMPIIRNTGPRELKNADKQALCEESLFTIKQTAMI